VKRCFVHGLFAMRTFVTQGLPRSASARMAMPAYATASPGPIDRLADAVLWVLGMEQLQHIIDKQ